MRRNFETGTNFLPQDTEVDFEKSKFDFDDLMNDLEDGEMLTESQLVWAIEQGIDKLKPAQMVLDQLRKYRKPIITVPAKYIDKLHEDGRMRAQMAWDNEKAIRGSIRGAYSGHEDAPRVMFEVMPQVVLRPRFTQHGKKGQSKFFGVFEVGVNVSDLVIGKDIIESGIIGGQ